MLNTAFHRDPQADFEPVEELSCGDIIGNAEESIMFRRRLRDNEIRRGICNDFDLGIADAVTTMRRLMDGELFGSPEVFMRIYAAGVAILSSQEAR